MTVASGVVRALIAFAATKGACPRALAEAANIDPALLDDMDNRIAIDDYVVLVRTAKAMTGDPAFALHYGNFVNLSEVSVVGLIGYASETMAEAFAQLNRYGRLVVEVDSGGSDRFEKVRDSEGLWLVDHRRNPDDFPELTEITFARMVSGTRQFGTTPYALAVEVTHADPGYGLEYERILGAPVTFGAARNAMRIGEEWPAYRVALQPRYAFGILSEHADALLGRLEQSKTLRGRVEASLMPVLHSGKATIDWAAGEMGLSRQTLYRRLKSEGTSFEALLDGLRHRLALDYLRSRKASVNEVAYLVGFSDPAAFSRAFKRWTGKSPRAMRVTDSPA